MKTGIINELEIFRLDRKLTILHDELPKKGFEFSKAGQRMIRTAKRYAKRAERRAGKALCQPDDSSPGGSIFRVPEHDPAAFDRSLSSVHAYMLGDRHYIRAYDKDGEAVDACLSND